MDFCLLNTKLLQFPKGATPVGVSHALPFIQSIIFKLSIRSIKSTPIKPDIFILVGRVFANGQEDLGSILGRVIPKTLEMVLDTVLLNTQQYKVRIKAKMEQSRERSSALPYTPL